MARTVIFNSDGDRPNVQNKIIMVTDGESNREQWQTPSEAEAARDAGIEIYVVGIGDNFNYEEALDITDDAEKVITLNTFSELTTDNTVGQIRGTMCGEQLESSKIGLLAITNKSVVASTQLRVIIKYFVIIVKFMS